jgi:Helix-turn-helix domain
MGHSAAFRDMEWLAEHLLHWIFAKERPPEIFHFNLLGSHQDIAVLVNPLGGGAASRSLNLTFGVGRKIPDSGSSDRVSLSQAMLNERNLTILQQLKGRLPSPQTLRRVTRKMLQSARELKQGENCPELAQRLILVISTSTSVAELTLQLIVTLSQWGLIEITEDDSRAFVKYLCGMWRQPQRYRLAAEEAISFIFSNWIFPQDWQDFRRYARQAVWGCYAQGTRSSQDGSSTGPFRSPEDWAEERVERVKHGKRTQVIRSDDHMSVSRLVEESGICRQRIYEMIKAGNLIATKIGQSLRIERDSADNFIDRCKQKHELVKLRKLLCVKGVNKDTLRKQVYRLRKVGTSDRNVIAYIEGRYSSLLPKVHSRRPN